MSSDGSIQKALKILIELANGEPTGVRQLARNTDLPVTTVHRILHILEEKGFAQQIEGQCCPGAQLYRLGHILQQKNMLYAHSRPVVERLWEKTNETVAVQQYFPHQESLSTIFMLESSHTLRHVLALSSNEPLYAGSYGKAVLACLPDEIQQRIIASCQSKLKVSGLPYDTDEVRSAVAAVRQTGYAITYSEILEDACGIAAPLFHASGEVAGAIGISIPLQRASILENSEHESIPDLIRDAAQTISKSLGYMGPR